MIDYRKEPWIVGTSEDGKSCVWLDGKEEPQDEMGEIDTWIDCNTNENARRVAACVNACAGIGTDDLLKFGALAILGKNGKTTQQRNELLINLKKLVDINCPITGNPSYQELIKFWEFEDKQGRGIAKDMISAINAIMNCEANHE